MANLRRGQVSAEIDGTSHILRLAANEWAALEDELDLHMDEIMAEFYSQLASGKLRMKFLLALFHAAISRSQPEMTREEAGEMMSNMGLVPAGLIVGRCIQESMPEVPAEAPENPPKAATKKGSTGRRS